MITIKNNLNQSLEVGGRDLAVDGEIKVRAVDEQIERFAARGFVTIVEPAEKSTTPPEQESKKNDKEPKK